MNCHISKEMFEDTYVDYKNVRMSKIIVTIQIDAEALLIAYAISNIAHLNTLLQFFIIDQTIIIILS